MADFKPAYLIHGDDHGRISERRSNLRAMAEQASGVGGVELFEGEAATPENVAAALCAMTFAIGRRFVIVDGAERFKEAEVEEHLLPALKTLDPETTVAFFGREEGRQKVSPKLAKAIEKAGGVVAQEQTLKAKELPRWVQGQAKKLGLELDARASQALVARVGERQQRLVRELEKLALEHGQGVQLGFEEVEDSTARSSERQVWSLGDALVQSEPAVAVRILLELQAQGESAARLVPLMARRVREVLLIALRLEDGESPNEIKASTKGNPWAIGHRIDEARRSDADHLRRLLEALADLELATHGNSTLNDRTETVRTIVLSGTPG